MHTKSTSSQSLMMLSLNEDPIMMRSVSQILHENAWLLIFNLIVSSVSLHYFPFKWLKRSSLKAEHLHRLSSISYALPYTKHSSTHWPHFLDRKLQRSVTSGTLTGFWADDNRMMYSLCTSNMAQSFVLLLMNSRSTPQRHGEISMTSGKATDHVSKAISTRAAASSTNVDRLVANEIHINIVG